jgi:hypothetical protein
MNWHEMEEALRELRGEVNSVRQENRQLRQLLGTRSAQGGPPDRVSRAALVKLAAAGTATLVGVSALGYGFSTPAAADSTGSFASSVAGTPAVSATGTNGADGIDASSESGTALSGSSDSLIGVYGNSTSGIGVSGSSTGNVGVSGTSTSGLGGQFFGGLAPLRLVPAAAAGAPGTTNHNPGEIYVDSTGAFYISQGTSSPVWNRINSVVPIPNVRVINTRPSHQIGPVAGPINNNVTNTWTLAGSNGIPSTAIAVVGNVTAADATAGCFLAVVPSGANHTGVSTVNFPALAAGSGVANAFTVGLTNGAIDIYTGNCSSYTVNIIVDIVGYIV